MQQKTFEKQHNTQLKESSEFNMAFDENNEPDYSTPDFPSEKIDQEWKKNGN